MSPRGASAPWRPALRCPARLARRTARSKLAPLFHCHWRDGEAWRYEVVTPESGGRVAVPCPAAVLTLDQIYAGVTLRPRVRRVKEGAPA